MTDVWSDFHWVDLMAAVKVEPKALVTAESLAVGWAVLKVALWVAH